MQTTLLRRNALLVSGLAVFFWWAFMFAKHDSLLRRIVAFGEDPYDAVSSFGAVAAVLLAMLSLIRAFFPQWSRRGGQSIYVMRAQAAIPFCVLVTVAAEAVAMARHRHDWVGLPGSARLLVLQVALTVLALFALTLITNTRTGDRRLIARAAAVWVGSLFILAIYPEQLILNTPGHLLTVGLGAVLLFAPVSALVKARLPNTPPAAILSRVNGSVAQRYSGFAAAAAIGLAVGVAAYAGELSEEKNLPALTKVLFVGGVYLGLGASGMVVAYACLGRLLGFAISEPHCEDT